MAQKVTKTRNSKFLTRGVPQWSSGPNAMQQLPIFESNPPTWEIVASDSVRQRFSLGMPGFLNHLQTASQELTSQSKGNLNKRYANS